MAVKKLRGRVLIVLVLRIIWKDVIYMIWNQRNNRIFSSKECTPMKAFEMITEVIKFRLTALKHIKPDSINLFFSS